MDAKTKIDDLRKRFARQFVTYGTQRDDEMVFLLEQLAERDRTIEVLRNNMHQAMGDAGICFECGGLLPKHNVDCELAKAIGGMQDER